MDTQKVKQKAEKLFVRRKWDRALKALLKLREMEPSDLRIRLKIAETLLRLNRMEEAQILFRQVADLYAQDGQLHKAIAVNHRLLEIDREDREIQAKLASLYERHGSGTLRDLPVGPDEIDQTLDDICQDEAVQNALDLGDQLNQQLARGDWQVALETAIKLWHLEPSKVDHRLAIARCLTALERIEEASDVYFTVANQFLKQGQPLRATYVQTQLNQNNHQGKRGEIIKRIALVYGQYGEKVNQIRLAQDKGFKQKAFSFFQGIHPGSEEMENNLNQVLIDPIDLGKIRPTPILSQLSQSAGEAFINQLNPITLAAGEAVFKKNDSADSFFIIAHGQIGLYTSGQSGAGAGSAAENELKALPDRVVNETELLGLFGYFLNGRRQKTAVAQMETELLEMKRADLERLCRDFPHLVKVLDTLYRNDVLPHLLLQSRLFQNLEPHSREDLAHRFDSERFDDRPFVIKEGQRCDKLFFLREGTVDVFCGSLFETEPLASLNPGDFFGEMAWITGGVWPLSFQANGPVVLMSLLLDDLDADLRDQLSDPQQIANLVQKQHFLRR